jgi:GAF domain-containing protein
MALTEESVRELAQLSGVVLAQQDLLSTHQEITCIALRALPGADGVSITTFRDGRPEASAASSDWARQLDEMQYLEHEGPCLDSARTGNVFRIADVAAETRWPGYLPRAGAAGVRSLLSVPLAAEGRLIGALNLYAKAPEAFTPESVSVAEIIAAHTGLATQVASAYFGQRELADQLRQAMESRAVIEQAKGVVLSARGCDADEAFTLLRQASQQRNVKLRDVAAQVVAARSADGLG